MASRSLGTRLRLVVVVSMAAAVMAVAPSVAASSPVNSIELTKTCTSAVLCTVRSSTEPGVIPVGTTGDYLGPLGTTDNPRDPRLSSEVVLTTPSGSPAGTATGHCTLSYKTLEGTCTFARGTGSLAGFHANLKVSTDTSEDPWVFTWAGTYHFGGGAD